MTYLLTGNWWRLWLLNNERFKPVLFWVKSSFAGQQPASHQVTRCFCSFESVHSRMTIALYTHCWQNKAPVYATGTWWCCWLRHCTTSWKVTGSIPGGEIGIFHLYNPYVCTMALRSLQPLTEMFSKNIAWGGRRWLAHRAHNLMTFMC
jgi:hypothetical protein